MGGGLHEPGLERDRERVRVCTCPVVGVSSRKEYSRFCEESTLNVHHRRGVGTLHDGRSPSGVQIYFYQKKNRHRISVSVFNAIWNIICVQGQTWFTWGINVESSMSTNHIIFTTRCGRLKDTQPQCSHVAAVMLVKLM